MSDTTTVDQLHVERLAKIASQINKGSINWSDLLKEVATEPTSTDVEPVVPKLPVITEDQKEALERLVEVFGLVAPDERRALEPIEVENLIVERQVLDKVEELTKGRKEAIRTTVYNHLDVLVEEREDSDPSEVKRDSKGHYVTAGKVPGTGDSGQVWSREVRGGSPSFDMARFQALADDPEVEGFTHEDYLAMTSQVRVFDEAKALLVLRKKPALLAFVDAVTTKSGDSTALFLRKA